MQRVAKIFAKLQEAVEEFGGSSKTHPKKKPIQNEMESEDEHHKSWIETALQKGALLDILNNSRLLSRSITHTFVKEVSGENGLNLSIDSVLSCNLSERGESAVEGIKCGKKENSRSNYLQLLQHEVRHLREKFVLGNRIYQMEDLMRLTVNSKTILNLASVQKYTDHDRKLAESVYQDLESLRVNLERKMGMCTFLKVYGKMVKIINEELESSLKSSLENECDGKHVKELFVAGDSDDIVKNAWKSIVSVLGDQQEYLPDVWELAMSENIYYHL